MKHIWRGKQVEAEVEQSANWTKSAIHWIIALLLEMRRATQIKSWCLTATVALQQASLSSSSSSWQAQGGKFTDFLDCCPPLLFRCCNFSVWWKTSRENVKVGVESNCSCLGRRTAESNTDLLIIYLQIFCLSRLFAKLICFPSL